MSRIVPPTALEVVTMLRDEIAKDTERKYELQQLLTLVLCWNRELLGRANGHRRLGDKFSGAVNYYNTTSLHQAKFEVLVMSLGLKLAIRLPDIILLRNTPSRIATTTGADMILIFTLSEELR